MHGDLRGVSILSQILTVLRPYLQPLYSRTFLSTTIITSVSLTLASQSWERVSAENLAPVEVAVNSGSLLKYYTRRLLVAPLGVRPLRVTYIRSLVYVLRYAMTLSIHPSQYLTCWLLAVHGEGSLPRSLSCKTFRRGTKRFATLST